VEAGNDKRSSIEPNMVDEYFVKKELYVSYVVVDSNPFGRVVNIGGNKEGHGEITTSGLQVVIRIDCNEYPQKKEGS